MQTAFGRKGKGQDGKLTVLDTLAAAKQDAAERGKQGLAKCLRTFFHWYCFPLDVHET